MPRRSEFRILLAVDGSVQARTALATVLRGPWPEGTRVRAVAARQVRGPHQRSIVLTMLDRSAETAAELGLPDVLPTVSEPGTIVGHVTPKAAEATGLAVGTPVVAGGGDTQLALLGAGLTAGLRFATVGGTFWCCVDASAGAAVWKGIALT